MKDIIKPIAVLAAICLVVTALLAYINSVTAPIIADANAKAEAKAQHEVLTEADAFEDIDVESAGLPKEVTKAVKATNGAGYVFSLTVKGYGGDIDLIKATARSRRHRRSITAKPAVSARAWWAKTATTAIIMREKPPRPTRAWMR